MEGGRRRKTKGKSQQDQNINNNSLSEGEDGHETTNNLAKHEDVDAIQANIITEIKAVCSKILRNNWGAEERADRFQGGYQLETK